MKWVRDLVDRVRPWRRRVRLELQAEAADCGLACVTMVANYHGYGIGLQELKTRFSASSYGHRLPTLKKILEELNFSASTVRFDAQRPDVLATPSIVHWKPGHFVVLAKVDRRLTIYDPARGKRTISRQDFAEKVTGFAIEAQPSEVFETRAEPRQSVIRPFLRELRLGGLVLRLLAISGLIQAAALALPFFAQTLFDEAVPIADHSLVVLLAVSFCGVSLFSAFLRTLYAWGSEALKIRMAFMQSRRLFAMLLRLPLRFFERRESGELLGAFMSLERIKDVLAQGLLQIFSSGGLFIALFLVMLVYSPALLGFVALASALRAAVTYLFFFVLNRRREETFHLKTKLNSRVLELISVMQAIKVFARQDLASDRFREALAQKLDCDFRLRKLSALEGMVIGVLEALDHIIFVSVASILLMDGRLSFGEFFAFSLYKSQFQRAFTDLLDLVVQFRSLSIFRARLEPIVLHEEADSSRRILDSSATYALRLDDVGFRYSHHEPYIFRDLNLLIEPGESVAIIGPSGRGKTTLCKLISGLLEPESGCIRVGRVAMGRTAISAAMQNDQLLLASIRENISFFDSNTDSQRVLWAAQQANILEEIEALPMGFDTVIGDSLNHLSGGQRQRILLARALYPKPSVLLLDESTSHLDVQNERVISANIKRLKISRVIFSHRPETIATCDRVITVDELDGGSPLLEKAAV